MSSAPRAKEVLSEALFRSGLLRADLAARGPGSVLAVNYHGTPRGLAPTLERHFAFYRERFECLDEGGLLAFLRGTRALSKPGVVISFDDGLRNNAEIAAPLLEQFGLVGWFMIPGGYLEAPREAQPAFFREHIRQNPTLEHPEGVPPSAMTWEGVRALIPRGHVIACHTWSHCPLGPSASEETVEREVTAARTRLEEKIDHEVRTFCWVRGQVGDYGALAHRAVCKAYDLAFMTMSAVIERSTSPFALHRFNVEASFPLPVVRFQVSRLNELAFARRRRTVERIIRGEQA